MNENDGMDQKQMQWAVGVLMTAGVTLGTGGYWQLGIPLLGGAATGIIIYWVMEWHNPSASRQPAATAKDWRSLAVEFKSILEGHVWTVWKRPVSSQRREWYFVGEKNNQLEVLVKNASQLLANSGRKINGDLPPHVKAEKDPINRWFELVASGNVIAVGEDDKDGFVRGRFVGALVRSAELCEKIAGMI